MKRTEIRINKYLADSGVCSRRQADRMIEQGRVTVNGVKAEPGLLVSASDEVWADGKKVCASGGHVVLAYYKPTGVICTEHDRHAGRNVVRELGYNRRVTYAGRLDKDSEGLLIMTDDGDLIQAMMKGANRHEKEYIVRVDREVSQEDIKLWAGGMYLKELDRTTRPCEVQKLGKYTVKFILTQGLNRQIRRMCKERNYRVVSLKRTRVMNVGLGSLEPGAYRQLAGEELKTLYEACGMHGVACE